MESALKWKYDKEIAMLNVKLETLGKIQRTVRKRIGDAIVFEPERRGIPGPNREKICQEAYAADEEWQRLVIEENVIREKIDAWNSLLKVNILNIPSELIKQFNEEYGQYKHNLIQEAINKLFVYDSSTKKFIIT